MCRPKSVFHFSQKLLARLTSYFGRLVRAVKGTFGPQGLIGLSEMPCCQTGVHRGGHLSTSGRPKNSVSHFSQKLLARLPSYFGKLVRTVKGTIGPQGLILLSEMPWWQKSGQK